MNNAKKAGSEPREGGITRRRLVKIINVIGAGVSAVVIAGKETTAAFAQQVKDALGSVLPFPPVPTASIAGPTLQEFKHVRRAEPNHLPADAPNILIVLLDDVGFGLADTLRRRGPHADADAPRQRGRQLQHVPHDLDLLADARGAADRAQSPARRLGHHRRARARFGRLYRRHPEDLGDDRRGAARLRLQDRGLRQMAQHAGDRDDRDGAVRPLADRLRLRLFLRLPRRRDVAIGAAPVREHQSDRAAARRDLSPECGHGRQGAGAGCASIRPSRPTSRS